MPVIPVHLSVFFLKTCKTFCNILQAYLDVLQFDLMSFLKVKQNSSFMPFHLTFMYRKIKMLTQI